MIATGPTLLAAREICKTFRRTRQSAEVVAVDGVSLSIGSGEIYGLVGESGSGKSTLSRILIGIETRDSGEVEWNGSPIRSRAELFALRRQVQYVFQDPFNSLPPHMTVGAIVEDPLVIHGIGRPSERRVMVAEQLESVGLKASDMECYPAVFSGGQRQRISLARALVMKPKVVICDEITSGLDVSVQAQILNLLLDLHEELGLSYLFVSHDLRVVRYLCDRVGVMRYGSLIEEGTTQEIFEDPQAAYTQELLRKVPVFDGVRTGGDAPC